MRKPGKIFDKKNNLTHYVAHFNHNKKIFIPVRRLCDKSSTRKCTKESIQYGNGPAQKTDQTDEKKTYTITTEITTENNQIMVRDKKPRPCSNAKRINCTATKLTKDVQTCHICI
jgi:hypothetical protein